MLLELYGRVSVKERPLQAVKNEEASWNVLYAHLV
jgi:hypothetical protein